MYLNKKNMNINDIESFIFIHDQDIILKYEENEKFSNLLNYTYVFVGNRPIDKLKDIKNIIYANSFEDNYENYPKMTAYSGWYILYKYNLISKKYVNLFEYDIVLSEDFNEKQIKHINDNYNIYGYKPFDVNACFLDNPIWSDGLTQYYSKKYGISLLNHIINLCKSKNINYWSTTSNVTFNTKFFKSYMENNLEIFEYLKNYDSVGHNLERNLSVYYILNDINIEYILNSLTHYQLDSHMTQGISLSNFDTNIDNLTKNKFECTRK